MKNRMDFKKLFEQRGQPACDAAKKQLQLNGERLLEEVKRNCPVHSGRLRDSIKLKPNKNGTVMQIVVDAANDQGTKYGWVVEYGFASEHSFLWPSYHKLKDEFRYKLLEEIAKACKQTNQANGIKP